MRFRAGSVVSSKELRTWPVWIDFHANLPLTTTERSPPFASCAIAAAGVAEIKFHTALFQIIRKQLARTSEHRTRTVHETAKKMAIILLRKGRENGSIDRLSLLPPKGRIMLLRRDRRPEYRPRSCLLIRSEIPSFHTHGVFTRHVHTDRMAS